MKLDQQFPPEYADLVSLLGELRTKILDQGMEQRANSALFYRLLEGGLVEMVLEGDWFSLQMLLLENLPEGIDGVAVLSDFVKGRE
jgi:precorrin-2 dehydrogenase/sirohydrochlorin ferrochelatase